MSTQNTTPAAASKRFALIGEVDGQELATGFWRSQDAADKALEAAVALAGLAEVRANLRLIAVDNAVLGNANATADALLKQLAPDAIKAYDAKAKAEAKKIAARADKAAADKAAKAAAKADEAKAETPAADKPAAKSPRKRGVKASDMGGAGKVGTTKTTAPGGRETVTREPAPETPATDDAGEPKDAA